MTSAHHLRISLTFAAAFLQVISACKTNVPYVGSDRTPASTAKPKIGAENASGSPTGTPQGKTEKSGSAQVDTQPLPKLNAPQQSPNANPFPTVIVGIIQGIASAAANNAGSSNQPQTGVPSQQAPAKSPVSQTIETNIPQATCPMYGNSQSQLFCVKENGTELIGTFQLNGVAFFTVTDIAISLTGRIYAISPNALYLVDPTNAKLLLVREINVGQANALTVLSDGRLVVAGTGVSVLDLEKNQLQTISATTAYRSSGDIVGLPDKKLYWTVSSSSGDQLAVVDVFAGTVKILGKIGQNNVLGLAYTNGNLYGFSDIGKIFTINQQTGAAGTVIKSDSTRWWGATTNPVRW